MRKPRISSAVAGLGMGNYNYLHYLVFMKHLNRYLSILPIILISISFASAQSITSAEVDVLAERTLKAFDVPGIAVAIIKDGKVIHSKGYGVRSLGSPEKVDENTLFGIASNSKAFTAATLGILVDEGKLKWDDRVIDYIPEFRMYNAYVTEEFTIRDLLTHRSGLGLGAGDLMFWPGQNSFTMKDIIHNLRYLKPVSGFRTKYDYDNLLYMVAGEVVARVSGKPWEEFVEEMIMRPLGMSKSASSFNRLKDKSNVIAAHAVVDGKVKVIDRDRFEFGNSAGGINSSISELSKWVIMQLQHGKYGDEKQLFSENVHEEMWDPQTIIPVRSPGIYNTHFNSYGLGWNISDVMGYKQASHTGFVAGMVTQVTMVPELNLGIIVLTNQQIGAAFSSITNQIKDSYFGIKGKDRVKENADRMQSNLGNADKVTTEAWKVSAAATPPSNLGQYTGTYRDVWFGDISIRMKNGKLFFGSQRSPRISGEMFFYKGNTFLAKWTDRSLDADAFIMFSLDYEGSPSGIKMKPISPLTDFSYDFQDLDFKRVQGGDKAVSTGL
ncbi:serine hydrolase [Daejeonella sp.]|uniref:serine hydrolase n=1 Tax=Daejeonella sp. TaxID=2805397 RepID=UPI0030C546A8